MVLKTLLVSAVMTTSVSGGCGGTPKGEPPLTYLMSEDAPDPAEEVTCGDVGDCPPPPMLWDEVDGNEASREREPYRRLDVKVDWEIPQRGESR